MQNRLRKTILTFCLLLLNAQCVSKLEFLNKNLQLAISLVDFDKDTLT